MRRASFVISIALSGACANLLGLDEFEPAGAASGGALGGASGQAGVGGSTPDGTAGASGSAGSTTACSAGTAESCFSGDPTRRGVGQCVAGTRTCDQNGSWGACENEVLPAAESCIVSGDEDCNGYACSEASWLRKLAATNFNWIRVTAYPPSKAVYIAGTFSSDLTFEDGQMLTPSSGSDAFVAKLDANGMPVWIQHLGSSQEEWVRDVAVDPQGNVLVAGFAQGSVVFQGNTLPAGILVMKLDSSGKYVWHRGCGGTTGQFTTSTGWRVAAAGNGDVVFTGTFIDAFDCGGGKTGTGSSSADIIVGRLASATGNAVWAKSFGSPNIDQAPVLAVDAAGNAFLGGTNQGLISFDSCQIVGGADGYLVRLDPQGLCAGWMIQYGSQASDRTLGVAVGSDGKPVMVGAYGGPITVGSSALSHDGGMDMFVAKLETSGAVAWTRRIGDYDPSTSGGSQPASVATTSSDDIVVAGTFQGTMKLSSDWTHQGPADGFVAWLSRADGSTLWARLLGGANFEAPSSVAVGSDDLAYVAGTFEGTIDFGTGPKSSGSTINGFVAEFQP